MIYKYLKELILLFFKILNNLFVIFTIIKFLKLYIYIYLYEIF